MKNSMIKYLNIFFVIEINYFTLLNQYKLTHIYIHTYVWHTYIDMGKRWEVQKLRFFVVGPPLNCSKDDNSWHYWQKWWVYSLAKEWRTNVGRVGTHPSCILEQRPDSFNFGHLSWLICVNFTLNSLYYDDRVEWHLVRCSFQKYIHIFSNKWNFSAFGNKNSLLSSLRDQV